MKDTDQKPKANRKSARDTNETGRDNFIVIAALLAGLASLLFNWFGAGYAITHILEEEAEDRASRWGELLKKDLHDLDQVFSTGTMSSADQGVINSAVKAGKIIRYKIFNADGRVVFASRSSDIGTFIIKPYFESIVKKGETFATIDKDIGPDTKDKFVSEAYIPIMENGQFRGAIEVYTDVTKLAQEMLKLRIWAFVVLCGFTLLLVGLFAVVVVRRKISQEIADQSLIAEQATKAVNEALEQRVAQRTKELEYEIRSHLETEAELVDAMTQADRANKAKAVFLSSISHELRTPMNAIMGFTQMLMRSSETKLDERESENLQHIVDNGNRLLQLIDQLLSLSKLQSGGTVTKPTEFKTNELIMECVNEADVEARIAGVTLSSNINSCEGQVTTVDRECLKQALHCLLSNAIKYNKKGGIVDISCDARDGGVTRISVLDTGKGIPESQRENVFQSFDRLGHEGKSTDGIGIGLSVAKNLVDLIDGEIGFESIPDSGSTFWIELPAPNRYVLAAK